MRFWHWLALFSALFLAVQVNAAPATPTGRLACKLQENGKPASGSLRVLRDGTQIFKGPCERTVEVPLGSLDVEVMLDGAADAPVHAQRVEVKAAVVAHVNASFETGEIVVELTRDGRRTIGAIRLLAGATLRTTLSASVPQRVSAGTYRVEIESRGEIRVLDDVAISRGEKRTIRVDLSTPIHSP